MRWKIILKNSMRFCCTKRIVSVSTEIEYWSSLQSLRFWITLILIYISTLFFKFDFEGIPLWLLLQISPVKNERNTVVLFLCTFRDITALKQPIEEETKGNWHLSNNIKIGMIWFLFYLILHYYICKHPPLQVIMLTYTGYIRPHNLYLVSKSVLIGRIM